MSHHPAGSVGTSSRRPSHPPLPVEPEAEVGTDDDESDVDEEEEGIIAPIAPDSVERIVAGQAVSDLAGAVKELVDNALDAGAQSINIRLFNQGIDILEVSDDGSGVPRASRPLLAMKHATSKIRKFDDLYEDRPAGPQLGFRGEALFCLANVSENLVISTRTEKEELGQKIEFGRDGYMRDGGSVDIPRKVGTTVAVLKLFDALPVRRTDMIRRIKAQRSKLMKMMQGYGILCLGVRFNLIDINNQPAGSSKCKSEVKMTTSDKSTSFDQTVSSVLGSKFLSGLCHIRVDLSDAVKLANEKRGGDDSNTMSLPGCVWRMEGLVSNAPAAMTGGKAVARDLQFFSINGRPVELPKISRVLGDVWRSHDASAASSGGASKKRPACVLSFFLPNHMYDVNLSPDKREVLLIEETTVCNLIRDALSKLWSIQSGGTFATNEVEKMSNQKLSASEETESSPLAETGSHASSITPDESTPRSVRNKMKRRNAFVHHFGNIGGVAPDPVRAVDVDSLDKSDGTPLVTDLEVNEGKQITPSDQDQICEVNRDSEDTVVRANTPPGLRLSDVSLSDHKKWEQTRLQFNRIDTSQGEEIQKLSSMAVNEGGDSEEKDEDAASDDSASGEKKLLAGEGGNGDNTEGRGYAREDPSRPEPTSSRPKRGRERSKVNDSDRGSSQGAVTKRTNVNAKRKKTSAVDSLKAFAFGAEEQSSESEASDEETTGGSLEEERHIVEEKSEEAEVAKGNGSEHPAGKEQGSHIRPPGQTTQEFKCHRVSMRRNSIVRTLEVAVSSLPVGRIETEKASTTKEEDKDALEKGEEAPEPQVSETISWDHFNGTQDVVQLARTARLKIDGNREILKRNKHFRHREETNDQNEALSADSVGVPEDEEPPSKRSKPSKRKEAKVVSLAKDDFLNMTIIGQFNLGFILARCQNNHLWILDQHACDEKYNFERLCSTTAVHEQKLIAPLPLELSPSEENCVLEHKEIFEQNGFRFSYDPDSPPRHRLSLTALPHSGSGGDGRKAVQFGPEDVGELCAILGADGASSSSGFVGINAVRRYAGMSGSSIIRLPKAVAMFASRACRGSIMIGTALSQKEMENVVRRLRNVEQPWDCPHGRPTMRHVKDLVETLLKDEREAAQHIAGPSLAVLSQADDDDEDS